AIVHDFSNYIGVLEVMLVLLRRSPNDATLWLQTESVVDVIRRLDATLLEYARGGAPERVAVDLVAIVRDTLSLAARVIPPDVKLVLDIADGTPVLAVRTDLEQLVLNLVINACDAMPRGGELRVSVAQVPYGMVLEVRDTGDNGAPAPRPKHDGVG